MIIQQAEVKRYNSRNELVLIYFDDVIINQDAPVYPDLKAQLAAERWDMRSPSDQKLDDRTVPSLFENKSLTRRR
jgi:hypothetical protein